MRANTVAQACGLLLAVAVDFVSASAVHYPNERRETGNATWWGATCRDVVVPVHVSKSAPGTYSQSKYDVNVLYALAARQTLVENDYNISIRVCDPRNGVPRQDTVQILVHGATFNKHMWDFPYQPEKYSWTKRMTEAGYTTVAVDLVGAGNSTFPNGLLESQTETYVQVMHDIVQKVRAGEIVQRKFKQVAFVGFSIGGIVANGIADKFPDDVDVFVLLGISWDLTWIYPAFLAGLQTSASAVDPVKWGHLEPTYQTQSSLASREVACFFGGYDTGALETDYATRDFDTLGAAITFTYHLVDAPRAKAPVFLGIGENDSTFCGGRVCGVQPYMVYQKFPLASDHTVRVYENTGHALMYHHVAPTLMDDVEAFLKKHKP